MNENKQEPEWLDRVRKTYNFHCDKRADDDKWTIRQTAIELKRSIGPVSEELKVASWLRTHGHILLKFDYIHEAIEWIRSQKHKQFTKDFEI